MKKVLSLVLALAMVLGSFSFVSAAPVSDVAGTVYEEAVTRLSLLDVLTGYPDGTFKPENTITRAEFAAVAVRVKGLQAAADASKGLATGFADVPAGNWAAGYVGTAGKLGIVNGVGNGLFAPNAPVKYEEAVTMIVRALGYEASAQTKGGYPYGYLIVANEIGLLNQVKGTQGAPAPRGIVAQIADNALEIPLMIQVGFGSETKWVVSGSNEHGTNASEQYLLDSLGFDSVKGRVTSVTSNRKVITVSVEDPDEVTRLDGKRRVSIDVPAGFDVYEVEGVETKFWYRDGLVIARVQEEAKYDALELVDTLKDEEIKLLTEDKAYEVEEDSDYDNYGITIDGKKYEDFDDLDNVFVDEEVIANYAKVVLNNNDNIMWAQGYSLEDFIVVENVKDDEITSYNDDELDIEDFLIVKDGKTITAEDLKAGDVVLYNEDEEFAVVATSSKDGKIERVYSSSFKFDGKNYDNSPSDGLGEVLYLDEEELKEIDAEVLEYMMDKEEEVTVIFDFAGNAVLVVGAGGNLNNDAYVVLTKGAVAYDGRKGDMLAIDGLNSAGEKVSYDVDKKFIKDAKFAGITIDANDASVTATAAGELTIGKLLKVTTDEDGDVKKLALLGTVNLTDDFKITDSHAESGSTDYRLSSGTIVFYDLDGAKYQKAVTLGKADDIFTKVETGSMYVSAGNVKVVLATSTDADTEITKHTGLVTKVRDLKDGEIEFTIEIAGKKQTFVTEDEYTAGQIATAKTYVNKIVTLDVNDKSGEVEAYALTTVYSTKITSVDPGDRTITTDAYGTVELASNAVIYNGTDSYATLRIRELAANDNIEIYYEKRSDRFVMYVIKR